MRAKKCSRRIKVPVLLGPTASGKTEIAVRLCNDLGLETVSCDSRQVYCGMDIGTAKPTPAQQAVARHWLLDVADPCEYFSAHEFAVHAARVLREVDTRKKHGLICGGTGFYYKCFSAGLGPAPPADPAFREKTRSRALIEGQETIFRELALVDPATASRLHARDTQRVIRALEAYYITGVPLSELHKYTHPPDEFEFCVVVVQTPRAALYERINSRVDSMMARGLFEEFQELRQSGYDESSPGMLCVGYRELFAVEQKHTSLSEASETIKRNTRRYAKRQLTWFRTQVRSDAERIGAEQYSEIRARFAHFIDG